MNKILVALVAVLATLMPSAAQAAKPQPVFTATFVGVSCDYKYGTGYEFVVTNHTSGWADFDVAWTNGKSKVNFHFSQPSGPANYVFIVSDQTTAGTKGQKQRLVLTYAHQQFFNIGMPNTCHLPV